MTPPVGHFILFGTVGLLMQSTVRLHIFLPTDEDGIKIPPTVEGEDRHALDEAFSEYFFRSNHASIRSEGPEIVSTIFEDRPDNNEHISELETECQRLYPEANVFRVRDSNDVDNGPEWEYREDIIIFVGNLGDESPSVRWEFGENIYGLQKSPSIGTKDGIIPLTDGKTLWGIATDDGGMRWSVELDTTTTRNPILVGSTIVIDGKNALCGYAIEDGALNWKVKGTELSQLTARPVSVDSGCYLGDVDGVVSHVSPEGELYLVCELDSRIEKIYIDENYIYAITTEPGQSGTTPHAINAIDRENETVHWTSTLEKGLNRHVVSGSEKLFVSTIERIISLDAATGETVWELSALPSEENGENGKEDELNPSQHKNEIDGDSADSHSDSKDSGIESNVAWKAGAKSNTSRLEFSTQPLFDDYLYAPTNKGVLKIEPDSGEIVWKNQLLGGNEYGGSFSFTQPTSPPTLDSTQLYLGNGDVVYAIGLEAGEIKWQFETPGMPGAITYCDITESITFISRGLAVNIDINQG